MSVYKLYAAGTGGTEDGAAQLDVQFDGEINAIFGQMSADLDADQEFCAAELSFISTNSLTNNDTRGSLFTLRGQCSVGAAGMVINDTNSGVGGLAIPVTAGERIWLHLSATAGVTSSTTIYIYVADGAAVDQRRRR